ncbi:hypothetical protein B0A50_02674 [Salinomyces thailandicus]|uniref:CwfJ domain-containing protein n=1 Tax=Salinomyces thailandicus TaxID=706561 RepID=A0A4U0U672_9PEZI|nr:hypothetical protein B0A50_02674 [Salinomyces thailandica]
MVSNKVYRVVIGDVDGKFSDVFQKVASLHKTHRFDFALIVGNLFADPATAEKPDHEEVAKLLRGEIEVPFQTYFAIGSHALPDAVIDHLEANKGELCPNLTALGRKVSLKTSQGMKIVALGGTYVDTKDDAMSLYAPTYNDADITEVTKGATDVDILITSEWPANVREGSTSPYLSPKTPPGVKALADLCTALKPRYHFSTSPCHYDREPFVHNGPTPRSVTRFYSLAPYGNSMKEKWIFAFALEPSTPPPVKLREDTTPSPFTDPPARKRKLDLDAPETGYNSTRFSGGGNSNDHGPRKRRQAHGGKGRGRQPAPTPATCYFCMSADTFADHMIGSISNNGYATVAKGPLTTRSTFPCLGFPGHVLIITEQHAATPAGLEGDEAYRQACVNDLQDYRTSLHDMIVAKSKGPDGRAELGAVTWDISRANGVHLHWQFVPVPADMVTRGLVEAGFDVEAENSSYPKFVKETEGIKQAEERGDFLKVMIWSETVRKDILLPLDGSFKFDLQFPRRVIGKLIGLEERTQWKDCAQTVEEETADALVMREVFGPFDHAMRQPRSP